jgi:hypothetical protein
MATSATGLFPAAGLLLAMATNATGLLLATATDAAPPFSAQRRPLCVVMLDQHFIIGIPCVVIVVMLE